MSMVADTGPILSFARANRLDLLRDVVSTLLIPDAVYEEIAVRGAGKPGAREVHGSAWMQRLPVRDRSFIDLLPQKLHLGEREAIALAYEQGVPLLVDEREARRAALHQGVAVIGSLQVLKEAKDRGIVQQVKPVLDALIAAGMYISEALYDAFLHQLNEAEETQQP